MSALCQYRTRISAPNFLFDHSVSATNQRQWHREPERLGSLEIEDQFYFRGLLYREAFGLLTPENAASIDSGLASSIDWVGRIAHETASSSRLTDRINCGDLILCSERNEPSRVSEKQGFATYYDSTGPFSDYGCERAIEPGWAGYITIVRVTPSASGGQALQVRAVPLCMTTCTNKLTPRNWAAASPGHDPLTARV
jgi:hypothetical protein